jgi:hypothetical protein
MYKNIPILIMNMYKLDEIWTDCGLEIFAADLITHQADATNTTPQPQTQQQQPQQQTQTPSQ